MQQPANYRSKRKNIPEGHHPNEVYVLRDWKEYIGESVLIVFSVLLALGLTEVINYFHDKGEIRETLHNIRLELIKNKHNAELQYAYQTQVLKNIDSALSNKAYADQILSNGELHLTKIAPHGVMYRDLDDVAWQVAKSHNIASKIRFDLLAKLTDIYDNQARITKLEDEVAKVLLSRESRDPQNTRVSLLLVRDNYKGWAYDRTPGLIRNYDDTIKMLDDE